MQRVPHYVIHRAQPQDEGSEASGAKPAAGSLGEGLVRLRGQRRQTAREAAEALFARTRKHPPKGGR